MPRSFLVKRRKSEDAKSVIASDLSESNVNNKNSNTNNHDALMHIEVYHHTCLPPTSCLKFHPPVLHFNPFERNQPTWYQSNLSCLHCRTRTFPHANDSCVSIAGRHACMEPHYCECSHRNFGEHPGCFCCCSPTPKLQPNVAQLQMPQWCSGVNCCSDCRGTYKPKQGQFPPKPLSTPLVMLDFNAGEKPGKTEQSVFATQTEKAAANFGQKLEHDFKVVKKEDALTHNNTSDKDYSEIPAKKMKTITNDNGHIIKKRDTHSTETASSQATAQSKEINVQQKNVLETREKVCEHKPKNTKELVGLQTVVSNSKLCNAEETDTKPKDIQEKLPRKMTTKPHQAKSKKRNKDGTVKPYNTRMATCRPRAYSSDFAMPEEEESDWNKDTEGFQTKGRQRSKLNRLLANEHERRRVAQLNSAYQDLRQLIPGYQCDTKLPKIKILKYAINYIAHLDDILEQV